MANPNDLNWDVDGLDWPLRQHSRFVQAGGLRWHVQHLAGPRPGAPCALLLHGTGASTHSWRDVAPLLARHAEVLSLDLPGHAFTGMPPGGVGSPQLTLPAALDFQDAIGDSARAARLRHLRDLWAEELRGAKGLEILTPADPRLHGGITSFRLAGRTGVQDNMAVAKRLLDEHRIFTVHRDGPVRGACVRVTPALFNSAADVGALVKAIRSIVPQS